MPYPHYYALTLTGLDLAVIIAGIGAIQFFLSRWFEARITESIKHEYDRKLAEVAHDYNRQLEEFKFEFRKREQAARVAEFLALAFDPKTTPSRFNQLAWELSLWLPADLVCDISSCLCGKSDARTPKEILVEVRKILLQSPNDELKPENILHREDPGGRAELTAAQIRNPDVRTMINR